MITECSFQSRLSAFHDGELDSETSARLEAHLADCESCREALGGIRAVSRLLGTPGSGRLSQIGLARLHETADSAAGGRSIFPLAKTMIAVAASILIIASAWLAEIPPATQRDTRIVGKVRPEAEWERLAGGGKLDSPRGMGNDTGVAIQWMVDSLKTNPRP